MNIVGNKNFSELQHKITQYRQFLDTEIENERDLEEVRNIEAFRHKYNLLPQPSLFPNLSQEKLNEQADASIALHNISRTFPKRSVAMAVLREIRHANQLQLFNLLYQQFHHNFDLTGSPIAYLQKWNTQREQFNQPIQQRAPIGNPPIPGRSALTGYTNRDDVPVQIPHDSFSQIDDEKDVLMRGPQRALPPLPPILPMAQHPAHHPTSIRVEPHEFRLPPARLPISMEAALRAAQMAERPAIPPRRRGPQRALPELPPQLQHVAMQGPQRALPALPPELPHPERHVRIMDRVPVPTKQYGVRHHSMEVPRYMLDRDEMIAQASKLRPTKPTKLKFFEEFAGSPIDQLQNEIKKKLITRRQVMRLDQEPNEFGEGLSRRRRTAKSKKMKRDSKGRFMSGRGLAAPALDPIRQRMLIEDEISRLEVGSPDIINKEFQEALGNGDQLLLNTINILILNRQGEEEIRNVRLAYSDKLGWYKPSQKDKIAFIINQKFGDAPTRTIVFRRGAERNFVDMVGTGLEERYPAIGIYKLDLEKLNKRVLALKTRSATYLKGQPYQRVSDKVQSILRRLTVEREEPTLDEYQSLTPSDRIQLDNVLEVTLHPAKHRLVTKDYQRYEVLKGELIAGNDNPEIVVEMKQLAPKLRDRIPKHEYLSIMNFGTPQEQE